MQHCSNSEYIMHLCCINESAQKGNMRFTIISSAVILAVNATSTHSPIHAQSAAPTAPGSNANSIPAPSRDSAPGIAADKAAKGEANRVEAKTLAPFAVDIATSATKASVPLIETPQSVSVVTRELTDAQGVDSLSDVLRYVAGVTPKTARTPWLR